MNKPKVVQIAGIAWYQPEHYARIKAIMEDGDALPLSYKAWERKAKHLEEQARRNGYLTVRAYLHPDEFLSKCRSNSRHVDAKARMDFANLVAKQAGRHGVA